MIIIIILAVVCAFGWSANVRVSESIDDAFESTDAAIDFITELAGMLTTSYQLLDKVVSLGKRLNETLGVAFPALDDIDPMTSCLDLANNRLRPNQTALASTISALNLPQFSPSQPSVESTLVPSRTLWRVIRIICRM